MLTATLSVGHLANAHPTCMDLAAINYNKESRHVAGIDIHHAHTYYAHFTCPVTNNLIKITCISLEI